MALKVFCKVHIRRDFIKMFGYQSNIVRMFNEIYYNYSKCEDLVTY